jgi:hypothetical protein
MNFCVVLLLCNYRRLTLLLLTLVDPILNAFHLWATPPQFLTRQSKSGLCCARPSVLVSSALLGPVARFSLLLETLLGLSMSVTPSPTTGRRRQCSLWSETLGTRYRVSLSTAPTWKAPRHRVLFLSLCTTRRTMIEVSEPAVTRWFVPRRKPAPIVAVFSCCRWYTLVCGTVTVLTSRSLLDSGLWSTVCLEFRYA